MMVVAILVLVVLLAIVIYLLALTLNRLQWANEDLMVAVDTEHAKCMGAVMAFIGDEYAAQVLRLAADDYDAVSSQPRLAYLRRNHIEGGPSIPAMWLNDRAEHLLALADKEGSA